MTPPDADGWIEWHDKGTSPFEEDIVFYVEQRLANGETIVCRGDEDSWFNPPNRPDLNVVAYRILEPVKPLTIDREKNLEKQIAVLKSQLKLAILVIDFTPEATLNELADQQLQALKKEIGAYDENA
jgi:hypothetical protein